MRTAAAAASSICILCIFFFAAAIFHDDYIILFSSAVTTTTTTTTTTAAVRKDGKKKQQIKHQRQRRRRSEEEVVPPRNCTEDWLNMSDIELWRLAINHGDGDGNSRRSRHNYHNTDGNMDMTDRANDHDDNDDEGKIIGQYCQIIVADNDENNNYDVDSTSSFDFQQHVSGDGGGQDRGRGGDGDGGGDHGGGDGGVDKNKDFNATDSDAVCRYRVIGRSSTAGGTSIMQQQQPDGFNDIIDDGVPRDVNGWGHGCVMHSLPAITTASNDTNDDDVCYYQNLTAFVDLTNTERDSMCSDDVIVNGAAQLRWAIQNGYCTDSGVELQCNDGNDDNFHHQYPNKDNNGHDSFGQNATLDEGQNTTDEGPGDDSNDTEKKNNSTMTTGDSSSAINDGSSNDNIRPTSGAIFLFVIMSMIGSVVLGVFLITAKKMMMSTKK